MSVVIYGDSLSGNCYKIKLLCALMDIEHDWIEVDIMAGDTQSDSFKQLNPNAKIPVLVTKQGQAISESNAILYYLAQESEYFPSDKTAQSICLQWMFFEQYSHEPYIAVARFINKYLGLPEDRLDEYKAKQGGGNKALSIMESQLSKSPYLLGSEISIADISLFAYTHVANEGGFCLSKYPKVSQWIARIKQLTGYIVIG